MVDVDQGRTAGGQTDVAALGSGVVGVAVSILVQPGAFGPIAAIVACTLGLVIVSYIGGHTRTGLQRLAFSSVMGLLAIPVVGCALEPKAPVVATSSESKETDEDKSRVPLPPLLAGWLITGVLTFGIDSLSQRRLARARVEPAGVVPPVTNSE